MVNKYTFPKSLIIFKNIFVRKQDLSHAEGPVMVTLAGYCGYSILCFF